MQNMTGNEQDNKANVTYSCPVVAHIIMSILRLKFASADN